MDEARTTIVNEPHVLEPAIVPAPSEAHWEDEARVNKREEQVVVNIGPLGNRASCDLRHHHAKREIENE